MPALTIETAAVRIAAFPEGDRLLTVKATCFGTAGACASARLAPRRHAVAPEDGLWDLDLIFSTEGAPGETATWRDVVFIGEADWCEGVRLHSPGGVLEHRIALQGASLAPRPLPATSGRRAEPLAAAPVARAERRFNPMRFLLDGTAAAMILASLSLLPMALPASATAAATGAAASGPDRN